MPPPASLTTKFALAAALALTACGHVRPTCELTPAPQVLAEDGAADAPDGRRLAVWDVADAPVLWSTTLPSSPSLAAFREEAARRVGDVTPATLLARAENAPDTPPREAELNRMLRAPGPHRIVPMRCFDALFLARQTERRNMVTQPTEVLTFVFRAPDTKRLRIVEYTVNQPGIGRLGPVADALDAAHAAGFRMWAGFHNHNFFFADDGAWHGGSVAPSAPDAELLHNYRTRYGLEEAWITNGFSTSIIPTHMLAPSAP